MANDNGYLLGIDPGDWLAFGQGLLSGPTVSSGIAQGVGGVRQARLQRAQQTRQAELDRQAKEAHGWKRTGFEQQQEMYPIQKQQAEQDLATKPWMRLSQHELYNPVTDETKQGDPRLAAKFNKGTNKTTHQGYVVGDDGDTYSVMSDNRGEIWYENMSSGKRHEYVAGATRAQDSLKAQLPKVYREEFKGYMNQAQEAERIIGTAERFRSTLDANPELWTGAGAESLTYMKNVAITLGVASEEWIDQTADMDKLRSMTMDFVMGRIQNTKGAISEKEMKAFERSSPNLQNTTEGNRRLLEMMIAVEERKAQRYDYISDMVDNGYSMREAKRAWNEYIEENEALNIEELQATADEAGLDEAQIKALEGLSAEDRKAMMKYLTPKK